MSTVIHFIDVGEGNMTLLQLDDGSVFLYDCNVTRENGDRVLRYLSQHIGWGQKITAFVCSHRDADHMCGVVKVHQSFPISKIWDAGVPGTTTDSTEYLEYMSLRRKLGGKVLERKKRFDYGRTRLRIMNAENGDLADNANAQGIVIKVGSCPGEWCRSCG